MLPGCGQAAGAGDEEVCWDPGPAPSLPGAQCPKVVI